MTNFLFNLLLAASLVQIHSCKTPKRSSKVDSGYRDLESVENARGFQLAATSHKDLMKQLLRVFKPTMEPEARMVEFERVIGENLEFLSKDLYDPTSKPQKKGWSSPYLKDGEYKKVLKPEWTRTMERLAETGALLDDLQKAQLLKDINLIRKSKGLELIKISEISPEDYLKKSIELRVLDDTLEQVGKIAYHGHGMLGGVGRKEIIKQLKVPDQITGKSALQTLFGHFDTYTKQGLGSAVEKGLANELTEVRAKAGPYSSLVDAVFGYFNGHFKSEELLKKGPNAPLDEFSRQKQITALEGIIDAMLPNEGSRIPRLLGGHIDPADYGGDKFGKAFRKKLAEEALDLKARSFLGLINVVGPTMQKILQTVVTLFDPALQKHLNSVKDALPPIDPQEVNTRMKNLFGSAIPGGEGKGILHAGEEEIKAIKEVWSRNFDTQVKIDYTNEVLNYKNGITATHPGTLEAFILMQERTRNDGLVDIDRIARQENWGSATVPQRKIANLNEVLGSVDTSVRNSYKGRYQRGQVSEETILSKIQATKNKIIDQHVQSLMASGEFEMNEKQMRTLVKNYIAGTAGELSAKIDAIPVRQRLGTATIGDAYKIWISNPIPPGGIGEMVVKFKKPGLMEKLEFERKVFDSRVRNFQDEISKGTRDPKDLATLKSQWAQFSNTVLAELNFENEARLLSSVAQSKYYSGIVDLSKGAGPVLGINQVKFGVVQVPPGITLGTDTEISKSTILMELAEGDSLSSLIESAESDYKIKSENLSKMHPGSDGYPKAVKELEGSMEEMSRLRVVMETAYSNWMESAFRTGHFHGDPHAGNIFVDMDAIPPKVTYIDLGGSGELSKPLRKDFSILIGYLKTGDTSGAFQAISRLCTNCTAGVKIDPNAKADPDGNTSQKIKSYLEDRWIVDKDGIERVFKSGIDSQDIVGRDIPRTERLGWIADSLKLDPEFRLSEDLGNYIRAFSIMEGNINEIFGKWGVANTDFNKLKLDHQGLLGTKLKDLYPDMGSFRKAVFAGELGNTIRSHVISDMAQRALKKAIVPATIVGAAGAIALGILFGAGSSEDSSTNSLLLEGSGKKGACKGKTTNQNYCLSFRNLQVDQEITLQNQCLTYEGQWLPDISCSSEEYNSYCTLNNDNSKPETLLFVRSERPSNIDSLCAEISRQFSHAQ